MADDKSTLSPGLPTPTEPPAGASVAFDYTTDPQTWSRAQSRAYQQQVQDAYADGAAAAKADFPCVASGTLRTQRACSCPGCKGAVAAASMQERLTGVAPDDGNAPARPGVINLNDPRLQSPEIQKQLEALLAALKRR